MTEHGPRQPFADGPYLRVAALCERVLTESDGVLSLIRVVDRWTHQAVGPNAPAEMPPFTINPTLVLIFTAGQARGAYEVLLRLESPDTNFPTGTLSQTVWVKDRSGRILVRTHRYLLPSGLIAGSGFLDPKTIYEDSGPITADRRHKDTDTCLSCAQWKPRAEAALTALEAYRRRG